MLSAESCLAFGPVKGVGGPAALHLHSLARFFCVPYGIPCVFVSWTFPVVHLCVPYGVLGVFLRVHQGILWRCALVSTFIAVALQVRPCVLQVRPCALRAAPPCCGLLASTRVAPRTKEANMRAPFLLLTQQEQWKYMLGYVHFKGKLWWRLLATHASNFDVLMQLDMVMKVVVS